MSRRLELHDEVTLTTQLITAATDADEQPWPRFCCPVRQKPAFTNMGGSKEAAFPSSKRPTTAANRRNA
jgi:hypothetical protein